MYRTKHDQTGDRADYFFTAGAYKGDPIISEPHKCDEIKWFPIDALPKNIMHHVEDAIGFIRKNIPYSEFSFSAIHQNPPPPNSI